MGYNNLSVLDWLRKGLFSYVYFGNTVRSTHVAFVSLPTGILHQVIPKLVSYGLEAGLIRRTSHFSNFPSPQPKVKQSKENLKTGLFGGGQGFLSITLPTRTGGLVKNR